MQDVGFDRRGQDGAVPLVHGGHDQPGGLARLGRSDDHHRGALLGRDQAAAVMAERDPPELRPADAQVGEVRGGRPFRRPLARRRVAKAHCQTPARPHTVATVMSEIDRTACSSEAPGRSRRSAAGHASAGSDRCETSLASSVPAATARSRSVLPCPSRPASALARIANMSIAARAADRPRSGQTWVVGVAVHRVVSAVGWSCRVPIAWSVSISSHSRSERRWRTSKERPPARHSATP